MLLERDLAGRLQASPRSEQAVPPPLLADTGDPAADALLAQVAGSLAGLFILRAGAWHSLNCDDFARSYLAKSATVKEMDEELVLQYPASAVDPTIRRAGLDRDPGWVQWLERTVCFAFDSDMQV